MIGGEWWCFVGRGEGGEEEVLYIYIKFYSQLSFVLRYSNSFYTSSLPFNIRSARQSRPGVDDEGKGGPMSN